MTANSSNPLDGIDPKSVTPDAVDRSAVRAALGSSNPLVRRRGVAVCETLAGQDIDAVRPFLDAVASLAGDDSSPVALRAVSTLDTAAASELAALEGRVSDLVGALDTEIVDVRLLVGTVLAKLVVERPDRIAPHARQLIESVRVTEPDPEIRGVPEVDDPVTRRTIEEHERDERRRLVSGRRTLINVVVAVAETKPRSMFGAVDDLCTLLDDVDPTVSGGAVDALGELAAENPAVVAPVCDRLLDCLDHERTVVRGRAVRALGRLGDDVAVEKLRAVAENDADEDVRAIAEKTADFLTNA